MNRLVHTSWRCKYPIVLTPKYRRQIIYGKMKAEIKKILRQCCERKAIEMTDIYAASCTSQIQCVRNSWIFEREKFSHYFDRHANLKYKYRNRMFWCRGYCVGKVGKNIKKYCESSVKERLDGRSNPFE